MSFLEIILNSAVMHSLSLSLSSAHKRTCRFSLKNNPQFVRRCIMLLCLNSKQHIMSEQIASRRDNEQHVKKINGDYEEIIRSKNAEYTSRRNAIRDHLRSAPETWVSRITGPENRAFLTFVLLIVFREESLAASKKAAVAVTAAETLPPVPCKVRSRQVDSVSQSQKTGKTVTVPVTHSKKKRDLDAHARKRHSNKPLAPVKAVEAAAPTMPVAPVKRHTTTPPLDLSIKASVKAESASLADMAFGPQQPLCAMQFVVPAAAYLAHLGPFLMRPQPVLPPDFWAAAARDRNGLPFFPPPPHFPISSHFPSNPSL